MTEARTCIYSEVALSYANFSHIFLVNSELT